MALIQKILVPVDFSEYSREAMRYACALAKLHKASVTLLHVYQVNPSLDPMSYACENLHRMAMDALNKTKKEALVLAPHVDTMFVVGVPYEMITQKAKDENYDLIVIGTHGRTGLKHALIGSVAERVVRHSPCPVLVVRHTLPS